MSTIFNIDTSCGKQRGLLSVYTLHSIKKQPKTGYDLIAEIKEKTEGAWVPSKGTIYPLLHQMQKENFITIKQIGERSKHIFMITDDGKKILINVKKQGKQMQENFLKFNKLIAEISGIAHEEIIEQLIQIKKLSVYKSKLKNNEVKKILKSCIYDLNNIKEGQR